jgi:hypothetical protein
MKTIMSNKAQILFRSVSSEMWNHVSQDLYYSEDGEIPVPPKRVLLSTKLLGVISQNAIIKILSDMKTP